MELTNNVSLKVSLLFAVATVSAALVAPAGAYAGEIKLATPEEALAACKDRKIGEWDLAYIIGKDGLAQWGWGDGYNCKQAPVPSEFSGVGNAVQAGGSIVTLASPEVALKACQDRSIGEYDIAYFIGKDGIAQWGWGYQCKQSSVPGSFSGVGNAITN